MSHKTELMVVEWNANGVKKRIPELQDFLIRLNVDIALINETKLKPKDKIFLKGYLIYRMDRTDRKGGGVAIVIKPNIKHVELPHTSSKSIENISLAVTAGNMQAVFTSVYNPKFQPSFKSDLTKIIGRNKEFFVIGDLNARHPLWNCIGTNKAGTELRKNGYEERFRHSSSDRSYV